MNQPSQLEEVLQKLETIREQFNTSQRGSKRISLADLIVLAGNTTVEAAARAAGQDVVVPFAAGRMDASQQQTDVESFAVLGPVADGFRKYVRLGLESVSSELLLDKAQLMGLSAPEMTVLVESLRCLNANAGQTSHGVFTACPGTLSNDYFVNLLDMRTTWSPSPTQGVYEGRDRSSGELRWTGTPVDLVFGSNAQLRALAKVYAAAGAQPNFIRDFAAAWAKVMNLDRFNLRE